MHIACPHCRAAATIRTSESLSPISRRLYCRCTNRACNHSFVAHAEITCTLSPSAVPNPFILLPMSPGLHREALIQQLRNPPRVPGVMPRPKAAADSALQPPATAPVPAPAPAFTSTTRPALSRSPAAQPPADSLPGNPWHPAPGFTLPEHIGRHLAATQVRAA